MTERIGQCPEITMFDLLRTLYYTYPNNCNLETFLFPPSKQSNGFGPLYIARISTRSSIPPRVGLFEVSFDFVSPITNTTFVVPSTESIIKPKPFLPFYRIFVGRSKDEKPLKDYIVDETFEPSAKAIHDKLKEGIIEAKKTKGKEAYDEITQLLQQPQVKS